MYYEVYKLLIDYSYIIILIVNWIIYYINIIKGVIVNIYYIRRLMKYYLKL